MLSIFYTFRSTTKLFDDFKFYDEQEKFRLLRVDNQAKLKYRQPKENSKPLQKKP